MKGGTVSLTIAATGVASGARQLCRLTALKLAPSGWLGGGGGKSTTHFPFFTADKNSSAKQIDLKALSHQFELGKKWNGWIEHN